MIWMGFFADCWFITGAPSTMKCPVAPKSDIAYWTAFVTRFLLSAIAVCGIWVNLLCIMLVHAFALVGRLVDVGQIFNILCCMMSLALQIGVGIFAS